MRRFALVALGALVVLLFPGCASQDEATRTSIEAGGTVPWNRPASWEGPGVLGSQLSGAQGGGY
jgi:hypothetical protein